LDDSVVRATFIRVTCETPLRPRRGPCAFASSASRADGARLAETLDDGHGVHLLVDEVLRLAQSSPAKTTTEVVPSPTSSSCALEMSTSTLAAALST
jgi:hypothetical protein